MERIIRGRVIKLGDNIDTDVIAPGRWKSQGKEVLKIHAMEVIRERFYEQIKPGDIIVAGINFGCGSHREEATIIMMELGIVAICADSVARIYFRNGIAYGLPIIGAKGISAIAQEHEIIEIQLKDSETTVINVDTNAIMVTNPLPEVMIRVLEAGGIFPLLKKELGKRVAGEGGVTCDPLKIQ